MSGFEPATVELLAGAFRAAGFTPVVGGAVPAGQAAAPERMLQGPLREGDAIGVSLVGGDLEMGATGTITHIDGDRIYAFGHPFFNLGPAEFPMTRAYVYTMLPSLMTSFKISTMGEMIGTMQQDRATAIAGTLGTRPRADSDEGDAPAAREDGSRTTRIFNYRVVNDQVFTPLLAYVALVQYARRLRAAVRRRDVQRSRAGRGSRGTATCRWRTSSPATAPCSGPRPRLPGR